MKNKVIPFTLKKEKPITLLGLDEETDNDKIDDDLIDESDSLILTSGIDSLGDSKKSYVTYFEQLRLFLEKYREVININLNSLCINDESECLDRKIKDHYSLEEIDYHKLKLVKDASPNNKIVHSIDELKHKHGFFIYSYGAKELYEIIEHISTVKTYTETLEKIEQNIRNINKINPKIEIYTLGLFLPSNILSSDKRYEDHIHMFNCFLRNLSGVYRYVHFVNNYWLTDKEKNMPNWHLTQEGHNAIYQNIVKRMEEKSKLLKKLKKNSH